MFNCQIRYAISCNLISNAHDAIHYLMLSGLLSLALLVFNEETNTQKYSEMYFMYEIQRSSYDMF